MASLPPTPPEQVADQGPSGDVYAAPDATALGVEAADMEALIEASAFGADLMALKAEIEAKLCTSAAASNAGGGVQSYSETYGSSDNIVGVGLTSFDAEALARGAPGLPGQSGIVVYTVEHVPYESLVAEIASVAGTRALSAAPIVQVPVGIVDAYSHRMRMRPAPGGISVGHVDVTAGTLGCLVTGNSAPRNSRVMILSNNHVLANTNKGPLGASIIQPGKIDGGIHPRDQIAILERFIPINFAAGSFNFVDCATGWAWPDRVRRELMYLSNGNPVFFSAGNNPVAPTVGMAVGKTGRTTQLRQGRITAVGVTVNVNFGASGVAQFRDQFSVRAASGDFSQGGDSGSLVWQWGTGLPPVGLLFAGGGGTTFCNNIRRVFAALDVRKL
jgi:hypothetical protein